ncbi:MAG: TRAP transporter small permease [Butyricicoccus sp.]|nr:TRAP transporter small permease [Butyricicoccus sp.]
MRSLKKAYNLLTKFEIWFLFIIFFLTTVAVVVNVFLRKLFNVSFPWIDELSRFIMLITICLGLSIAVTNDSHPRMDAVQGLFRGNAKKAMVLLADLITVAILAIVSWYAIQQGIKTIRNNADLATIPLKLWMFWIFIPIGYVGAVIRGIVNIVFDILDFSGKDPRKLPAESTGSPGEEVEE